MTIEDAQILECKHLKEYIHNKIQSDILIPLFFIYYGIPSIKKSIQEYQAAFHRENSLNRMFMSSDIHIQTILNQQLNYKFVWSPSVIR